VGRLLELDDLEVHGFAGCGVEDPLVRGMHGAWHGASLAQRAPPPDRCTMSRTEDTGQGSAMGR
jgi:hypothetical protein